MKGFPKNASKLNPMAVQQRMQKLAMEKDPEKCECGNILYCATFEVVVLSRLETGMPSDAAVQRNMRYMCTVCGKPWIKKDKEDGKEEDNNSPKNSSPNNGGNGSKGGTGIIV